MKLRKTLQSEEELLVTKERDKVCKASKRVSETREQTLQWQEQNRTHLACTEGSALQCCSLLVCTVSVLQLDVPRTHPTVSIIFIPIFTVFIPSFTVFIPIFTVFIPSLFLFHTPLFPFYITHFIPFQVVVGTLPSTRPSPFVRAPSRPCVWLESGCGSPSATSVMSST